MKVAAVRVLDRDEARARDMRAAVLQVRRGMKLERPHERPGRQRAADVDHADVQAVVERVRHLVEIRRAHQAAADAGQVGDARAGTRAA